MFDKEQMSNNDSWSTVCLLTAPHDGSTLENLSHAQIEVSNKQSNSTRHATSDTRSQN